MKDDERKFLCECLKLGAYRKDANGRTPRDIYQEIGIHPKRACRILEKWANRGWFMWGCSIDHGWMTPEGMERAWSLVGE